MKSDDVQCLIEAHYNSEEDFHSIVERIIKAEEKSGKETSACRLRATLNQCGGKKREGYTVKALHNLSSVNRDNEKMVEIRQPDIVLKDVIVPASTIATVQACLNEYRHRESLEKYGLEVSNKMLLNGPPGVGKTWMATAIAGELGLDLLLVRWDTVISSYLGSTGNNIRKVFETANADPVVLLIDEFDAGAKNRGDNDHEVGEMNRVVINLLQNIDMFPRHSFLIAATNHGQLLDTAIWRRFTVINMDLPTPELRLRLIDHYAKDLPIQIDRVQWVIDTEGLSGAEIKARVQTEAKRVILLGC